MSWGQQRPFFLHFFVGEQANQEQKAVSTELQYATFKELRTYRWPQPFPGQPAQLSSRWSNVLSRGWMGTKENLRDFRTYILQ